MRLNFFLVMFLGLVFLGKTSFAESEEKASIAIEKIKAQKPDERGNIPTFNKYGFAQNEDFFPDPYTIDFVLYAIEKDGDRDRKSLEIGAGFANLSLQVIKGGGKMVINDLDPGHLDVAQSRIPKGMRSLAEFVPGEFPDDLHLADQSLDAVFCRVLQFLSGKDIERGFEKIKRWLKPKGRIYILAPCIHMPGVNPKAFETFMRKRRCGEMWPGMNTSTKDVYASDFAYNLPDKIHVFDMDTIINALIRTGFNIQKVSYFDKYNRRNTRANPGRTTIGVIASPGNF